MHFSIMDEYITTSDDTIYRIANMFYLRWHLWRIIYDYNQNQLGSDPWDIPAGKKIRIINLNTEPLNHTVIDGDTWYTLALNYYGSPTHHWTEIATKNNYQHLIPGETIIIPPLLRQSDIKKAQELRNVCS